MDRRQDTREKIQLGGLVVKAGLRKADKAVILGILTEGAKQITNPAEHERLRRLGKAEFKNDDQTNDVDAVTGRSDASRALGPHRH